MDTEKVLHVLEGCLIEPILNDGHALITKRRVIEVQSDNFDERVCGYGSTFESALLDAAGQVRQLTHPKS